MSEIKVKLPIYIDYQATTPVDNRVLKSMLPYFSEKFGNPHSSDHRFGWQADAAIEVAREQIASCINASSLEQIIFTSGATESNNLAIKGLAKFYKDSKNHIITSSIEHKSVIESCLDLQDYKITFLPVDKNGLINLDELESFITNKTLLVSIMAVNNEIGTILPIKKIGQICKKHNVFFHCDGAQAIGKINIDVQDMNIDMLSISSHKLYGPKGQACLYINDNVKIMPLLSGGGQEMGLRPGTLSPALIVGFAKAMQIAIDEMDVENKRIKLLRDKLYKQIKEHYPKLILNADFKNKISGNLNISFPDLDFKQFTSYLKDIAFSSGSACSSGSTDGSYVLKAIGLEDSLIKRSMRLCVGRYTTDEQIDYIIDKIKKAVDKYG